MPTRGQSLGRAGAAGLAVLVGLLTVLAPGVAVPATAGDQCVAAGSTVTQVPWNQSAINADPAWPFAANGGGGITVAVLDSGVDAGVPQLSGHVLTGKNVLTGSGSGNSDCTGHGTGVAGIIAAQSSQNVGFHGVAPGASILPVVVSGQTDDNATSSGGDVGPGTIAKGIDYAVAQHADVIDVSAVVYSDNDQLHTSVQNALNAGIPVIAGVGTKGDAQDGNPTPYPASYQGVIGVGAVDQTGASIDNQGHGSYVAITGPGGKVITLQRGGGHQSVDGTAFAAAYVSGAAALVRARYDNLTPAEVAKRLEATASPAGGGPDGGYDGYGMVNPYQAVTAQLAAGTARGLPPIQTDQQNKQQRAWNRNWHRYTTIALLAAGVAVLIALAVPAFAVVLPRGRRRGWRPVLAQPAREDVEDGVPSPPVNLFDDPVR